MSGLGAVAESIEHSYDQLPIRIRVAKGILDGRQVIRRRRKPIFHRYQPPQEGEPLRQGP